MLLVLAISLGASVAPGSAVGAEADTTFVALAFDDGYANQYTARSILAAHGMHGTFYVNTGSIGNSSSAMTWQQLRDLAADGNEIAGHSTHHLTLSDLDDDELRRQICNDRVTLVNQGFTVTNLAYPFGAFDEQVKTVAGECGYNTGRGRVFSSSGPYAETIPPADPYALRTPDGVTSTTSLDTIKGWVTRAEAEGAGYLELRFHHICNGCDSHAITEANFRALLDWLQPRSASGTVVRTVQEVFGGPVQPTMPGPPPPPPGAGVANTSLEADSNADAAADCWLRAGYGTNNFDWTRTSDSHTGSFAEKLTVTSYSDGARMLINLRDLGSCSPSVREGRTYRLGLWYKSSAPAGFFVYSRNTLGQWSYWKESVPFPAASQWAHATWTTPSIPAGTTAVSFGLALKSVGTLTTDDYSLADTDATPPTVSLTAPAQGAVVSGTVTLAADASDDVGIDRVEFLVNGQPAGTDTSSPFSLGWDSRLVSDGTTTIAARATDLAGNQTTSPARSVTVANGGDTVPPTVSVTAPAQGAVVSGTVTLAADASDDVGIDRVEFLVNGQPAGTDTSSPFSLGWDSRLVSDGTTTIAARATDLAGNQTTSPARSLTVDNTAPQTTVACNGAACSTGWYRGSVSVTLTGTDTLSGATVRYTTDGSEPTITNGTIYLQPVAVASTLTLKFRAWDGAGNAEATKTQTIRIDSTAPTVSLTAPAQGAVVKGRVTMAATAADVGSGVARVDFYVDAKLIGTATRTPYEVAWNTKKTGPGSHVLEAEVADVAGNRSRSTPVTVTVG